MKIELKRKLELESYDVIMEIGRSTKRPDLIAVLKLADEKGYVTPESIVSCLLGDNYPESVGERIIDRCRDLGLLDSDGNPTETAREALENGRIFLPERGTYRIWFTRDPLFPQAFVSYRELKNKTLYNEVGWKKNGKDKRIKNNDGITEFPQWIREWLEDFRNTPLEAYGKKNVITILKIEEKCIQSQEGLGLTIELDIPDEESATLKLQGPDGEKLLDSPGIKFPDAWPQILGAQKKRWDNGIEAMKMKYEDVDEKERNLFKKDIQIERPILKDYDEFHPTVVKGVPVAPATKRDAARWARDLLKERITEYVAPYDYRVKREEIENLFSKFYFTPNDLKLPNQQSLAKEILKESQKEKPSAYWYLQATIDLNPEEAE